MDQPSRGPKATHARKAPVCPPSPSSPLLPNSPPTPNPVLFPLLAQRSASRDTAGGRDDLIKAIKASGLGGSELLAMHMTAQGQYLSRQLSYKGADFRVPPPPRLPPLPLCK